jgi:hypothetical protein
MGRNVNADAVDAMRDISHRGKLEKTCPITIHMNFLELASSSVKFGKLAKKMQPIDNDTLKRALHMYYNRDPNHPQVRYNTWDGPHDLPALPLFTDVYDYAFLDGRRITPTSRSYQNTPRSALIQVKFGNRRYAGEVRAIMRHRQPGVPNSEHMPLITVAWMKESADSPLDGDDDGFVWNQLCASPSRPPFQSIVLNQSFVSARNSMLIHGNTVSSKIPWKRGRGHF